MREKKDRREKRTGPRRRSRVVGRLRRMAAAGTILTILWAGALGMMAVDQNIRRTGLSDAPAFLKTEEIAPRQYRLELLGGEYTFTFTLPPWM